MELRHGSIADIHEAALVDRLTADPLALADLLGIRGISSECRPYTRLPFRGLPGEPEGDVDLLLVEPDQPHQATAVEVKRIKFGAEALRRGRPNKLAELPKAQRQVETLAAIGFWQVYLYAFVVIDSREQNEGRLTYDGLTSEQDHLVDEALRSLGCPNRVGLIRYDFIQPMDHAPLPAGAGGTKLVQLAATVGQPSAVTEWVRGAAQQPGAPDMVRR